jgi:hypothetical protein
LIHGPSNEVLAEFLVTLQLTVPQPSYPSREYDSPPCVAAGVEPMTPGARELIEGDEVLQSGVIGS